MDKLLEQFSPAFREALIPYEKEMQRAREIRIRVQQPLLLCGRSSFAVPGFLPGAEDMERLLLAMNIHYDIIYLNASDEELIRRYKETRRAHPMGGDKMLIQNIQKERLLLKDLEKRATRIIDTTTMLTRQLRETLLRLYGEGDVDKAIAVNVLSFGFKHGLPQDADLVFDVRFIPNPFYIPEMRPLTGADASVHDYVMSFEETRVFLNKTLDLLKFLIPHYVSEGKDRLVIAVGCTGGQHRSVCLTNEIAKGLKAAGFHATASHRDTQIETKEK